MARALTILHVAYPLAPVGPAAAGGAEQVLCSLDRALVARGHRSIVIAQEGSRVHGELVPIPVVQGLVNERGYARAHAACRDAIARVLSHERVDVIHMHGLDFADYLPVAPQPILATLHLPVEMYPEEVIGGARPGMVPCCVSETQRRSDPRLSGAPVVPNGIDLDAFQVRSDKQRYATSLGRICPEKGQHLALDAARWAAVPFVLAGRVFPYETHLRYLEDEIRPRLGLASWLIGGVGPRARARLLARARCVVVSSQIAETSCLVAMEALASGTPVVAFDRGALREVVEHGRTGFLVRDLAEMARAVASSEALDPLTCRRVAEQRLDASRMHDGYLRIYRELAT